MTELKKTPLHAAHGALHARMVDFGGWEMPVNYGSQIDEHQAVRSAAGMFDVSHMCPVDIAGAQAREFLKYVLANNVDKLQTPGRALYSCMLNEEGGVIDDLIVYFFAADAFRLVVNAATAAKDLAWLERLNAQRGCGLSITPRREFAMLAVQGPEARAKVWQAIPGTQAETEALKPFYAARLAATPFGKLMVARTGYTGEDGFELLLAGTEAAALWQALQAAGVRPCGLGARDTLRLEAGMNLYGQDMDDSVSPLDAGLAWTVDRSSGRVFAGRAALERDGQRQAFAGLLLRDQGGVLRAHQKVATPQGEGIITSGTFSPSLHASIALARLPVGVQAGATVQVQVRDRQLAASVVKLPFVRHGKVLVS